MIRNNFVRAALLLLLVSGLSACMQSVGPGGVQQSAGPASASSTGNNSCRISCSGRSYSASCPARENPLCQCSHAPYASCVGSVQPRQ
ncbi:MAG: hypothetical protein EPN60_18905 [Nevskiaceae bacterium]|nr:MAG: hypothetical protein EPO48_15230 [Nevskiaceae bacterium]TAM21141.1 MAG: hypothetical protein EPN60_18905 [Nevskiaceae bacterium]